MKNEENRFQHLPAKVGYALERIEEVFGITFTETEVILRAMFDRQGNRFFGSYFWSNCLDAMLLATPALIDKRPAMPNFKQSTVAEYLGIKIDENRLHNANYDIELVQAIYDKVCGK